MKSLLLMSLLLLPLLATAHHNAVQVSEPWVRAAPPTAPVMAAYLVLHNTDQDDLTLVGASSSQFSSVEIHRTYMENGMARMALQEQLVIPAKGQVKLVPGGLHIMLIGPHAPLVEGAQVSIDLLFADGSTITVTAPVRRADDH